MVEVEFIKGIKDVNAGVSNFEYYYGLVTVKDDEKEVWKIQDIKYIPEAFLCAPDHGWSYDAENLVKMIYGELYKLIDKIDKKETDGDMIHIYASGNDKQYRFDFVRITNGYDILLHENILENDEWKEINILKENDQIYKLSILNPNLK